MATDNIALEELANREYQWGFVTDIEAERCPAPQRGNRPPDLCQEGKPAFMLDWRLKAFRHWQTMAEPRWWPNLAYPPIDYQNVVYYSAPKQKPKLESLDQVDPELRRTFEKLGISLDEQKTAQRGSRRCCLRQCVRRDHLREELAKLGIVFCSFSEAVKHHPELVRKYLGSVVPYNDNYFATLNSAVFSDGSFVYIPKACAARWSCRLFPHQRSRHRPVRAHPDRRRGRRLRELPRRLHRSDARRKPAARAVVELVCVGAGAQIKYSTVQNWYPGDRTARVVSTTSSPARRLPGPNAARSAGRRSRPARQSPGNTPAASCKATARSASFTRWP